MGQALSREPNHIPYDVNAWRRLSFTYLNQLNENGEPTNDDQIGTGATGQRGSRPGTPPASRQSSFGSRNDINRLQPYDSRHSFRIQNHPGERVVLQEYEPSKKPNGVPLHQTGHGTGPSRETDFPPIDHDESANPSSSSTQTSSNGHRKVHQEHERPQRSRTDPNSGVNSGYSDLAFPSRMTSQSPPGGNGSQLSPLEEEPGKGAPGNRVYDHNSLGIPHRIAPPPPGNRITRVDHQVPSRGANDYSDDKGYGDEHDYQHRAPHERYMHSGHDQYPPRAQSPKSSTTWNTSSDDYQSSSYTDPTHPNHYDSHNHLSRNKPNQASNRSDNSYQRNGQKYSPLARSGQSSGSSKQSSVRVGMDRSDHYIPYKDYFIDRKIQGKTGPNSYSDFSGYSRNSQKKAKTQIDWAKLLFIVFALVNIASTIWNSVYMQLMSKRMELGFPIQGKLYSKTDVQRHLWEGFIITAQVLANLANIIAIYGALVNRYWIVWTYTWLMFLYGMFGAVSELTRGGYTSWLLPIISGQLAIVLTHQLAIDRKYRSFR